MTDTNQNLRQAEQALLKRYAELVNSGDAGNWYQEAELEVIAARQALALPTADHLPDVGKMVVDHFPDATKMIETAVPVGERDAFEREMRCEEEWGHRSLKKRQNGKYENWQVDLMWAVWQARAALSAQAVPDKVDAELKLPDPIQVPDLDDFDATYSNGFDRGMAHGWNACLKLVTDATIAARAKGGTQMTDTNQKLREVATELDRLMLVIESAVRHADPRNHAAVMALILANKEALLALPTAEQVDDINVAESFTSVTKTAAPVGEREAFEREMSKPPFEFCMDRWPDDGSYAWPGNYAAYHTQCAWDAWQARAALSAGEAVDAQRYRWLREQHWSNSDICCVDEPKQNVRLGGTCPSGDLLDSAIDAAMRKAIP